MKTLKLLSLPFIVLLIVSGCASTKVSTQSDEIGIVLMHGKGGTTKWIESLALSLESKKIHVSTPDMPWHKYRIYDKTFEESLIEIKTHVNNLRKKGAQKIYVAGHSLGAIAATAYAAQVGGVQGVILLAPGHFTSWHAFNSTFKDDLIKANTMIKNGKADIKADFNDINQRTHYTRNVTARIYKSWFSPWPAGLIFNLASLNNNTSILYIGAGQDALTETNRKAYAFNKAPQNQFNKYIKVAAKHLHVPAKSSEIIFDWLSQQ